MVVEGVTAGGAACLDGRIQRGDILLHVNDTPLRVSTSLSNPPAHRDNSLEEEDIRLLLVQD